MFKTIRIRVHKMSRKKNLWKYIKKFGSGMIVAIGFVIVFTSWFRMAYQWYPQFKAKCFWQALSWLPREHQLFTDAILALTAFVIYFAWLQLRASRTAQNLSILSHLNELYIEPKIMNIRERLFQGKPVCFSDINKFCNFLDQVGHIVFRLPDDEQEIAYERWSETFIRCWIRLREFVYTKRLISIGRDYVYFEWLASRCRESMIERFNKNEINIKFYEFQPTEPGMELHKIVEELPNVKTESYKWTENGFSNNGTRIVEFKDTEKIEKEFKLRKTLLSRFSLLLAEVRSLV